MNRIEFYKVSEVYGELSNFAAFPVEIDGKVWPTTEHYFQAQKFPGTECEEAIRCTASPMIAARMGRSRKYPLRPDWEQVKDDIMYRAVLAKFTQHRELRRIAPGHGRCRNRRTLPKRFLLGRRRRRQRPKRVGKDTDALHEELRQQ